MRKRKREKEIATARAIIEEYRQRSGEFDLERHWSLVTFPRDPRLPSLGSSQADPFYGFTISILVFISTLFQQTLVMKL